METCIPIHGPEWDEARVKAMVLKQIDEVIEDLRNKLAGGPPAQITQ